MTRTEPAVAPAVSVVLPVRNAAGTLADCLETVQAQTLTELEVLAVDDGSEDGSAEILRAAAARDPRIEVLQPGRIGLVAALNLGIENARAPLVARMDADDLMHPRRLEAQVRYLSRAPDLALVGCRVELFPAELVTEGYLDYVRWQNGCTSPDEIAANLYVESPFAHPSVTARTGVLRRIGGYQDGPFPEDYQLWLRLHRAGHRMGKVPEVLLRWRESPDRTSRVDPRYSREAFDRLRAEFLSTDPRVRQARELVVWGAGRRTRLRVRHLMERGVEPSAWIDIDPKKIGNAVWGRPVHGPAWLDRRPRPFVLVYVASHGARDLIARALGEMNYRLGVDYLPVG